MVDVFQTKKNPKALKVCDLKSIAELCTHFLIFNLVF